MMKVPRETTPTPPPSRAAVLPEIVSPDMVKVALLTCTPPPLPGATVLPEIVPPNMVKIVFTPPQPARTKPNASTNTSAPNHSFLFAISFSFALATNFYLKKAAPERQGAAKIAAGLRGTYAP
jgi:hypothetical protein